MPGAVALVTYNGTNITSNVLFERTTFTVLANAQPGEFEMTVKDPTGSLAFTTGKEVTFSLNGTVVFGGYIMTITRTFAFPDKTAGSRLWVLRGVDYNILFDKRVLRNTADFYHQLPNPEMSWQDGYAIKYALQNYADWEPALTEIDNVDFYTNEEAKAGAYPQQGAKVRDLFEGPALRTGSLYFISADKKTHYHSLEVVTSPWGFSDAPNGSTTYRMHDVRAVEDGSIIVNDALIWGGSEYSGQGGTAFSRVQSLSSESLYGRWQTAETHFGEEGFGLAAGCNARAKAIINGINGAGGTDAYGQAKGLRLPQWQMNFSWWLHDIPNIPVAGGIYTIELTALGITKVLPLRQMTLTFPELDDQGRAYVLMNGDFSLNVNDPFTIWTYLRKNNRRIIRTVIGSADDTSTATTYGAYGSFNNVTNVSGLVYKVPFGYIPSTLMVFVNGIALTRGSEYTETDNIAGTFTLASSPSGDLYATCRTLHS